MRISFLVSLSLVLGCSDGGDEDVFDGTFAAWGSSTSTVSLLWVPVDGASGYTLERIGGDTVTLGADVGQYLDRGLAEGTYSYRLTPIGAGEPQEAEASTSEDVATVTVDDAPIGDAVVATIGAAGGMIELTGGRARAIVPPGALPDGATVTLQEITAPTGAGDVAVDVSSEPAFTGAIEIDFALVDDETDGADPTNLAIADKQADGTWLPVNARVEGTRAIVSVTAPAPDARAAAPAGRNRFVRFRRIRIDPDPLFVRDSQERPLFAQAVFSDDVCQEDRYVAFCHLATGGPHNEANVPLPSPVVDPRRLRNDRGTWALGGPGQLHAVPDEHSATYFSPPSKPSPDRWLVTFTTRGARPITATSMIRFIDNTFLVELHYQRNGQVVGGGLRGNVSDMFFALVEVMANGAVVVTGGPYNMPSTVTNPGPIAPFVAVMQTSAFELATITQAEMSSIQGKVNVVAFGTALVPSTVATYDNGATVDFPGSAPGTGAALTFENVRLLDITGEQWFTDSRDPAWRMKVAPSPGP